MYVKCKRNIISCNSYFNIHDAVLFFVEEMIQQETEKCDIKITVGDVVDYRLDF